MANTIKHKRGSGSDPSASDLVAGELAIRTDTGAVFTKKDDGTVAQVTGASVGGATGVDFNDNVKVRFGTGNDLEIYHDGSNSYIKETAGTGNLRIEANDLRLKNGAGNEDYIKCNENAQVELYYNGAKKLETKSDGIDVTGDVRIVDNSPRLGFHDANASAIGDATGGVEIFNSSGSRSCFLGATEAAGVLSFGTNNSERLRIDTSGRLLVGGTSEAHSGTIAQIQHTGSPVLSFARNDSSISSGNGLGQIDFYGNDGGTYQECAKIVVQADNAHANDDKPSRMAFYTTAASGSSSTERMRIDSAGRVGIGTTSPARGGLHIHDASGTAELHLTDNNTGSTSSDGFTLFSTSSSAGVWYRESAPLRFATANTERMRITSSGDLELQGELTLEDSKKINIGSSNDLQIYHDGSNSAINDQGTGNLYIQGSSNIYIRDYDTAENHVAMTKNGSVELYHDGTKKLETKSDGVDIAGELQCDSLDVDGNVDITGQVDFHNTVSLQDSDYLTFGDSDDLQIYHDGSNSYIRDAGTGDLIVRTSRFRVNNTANTENMIRADENGAVYLYYDHSQKLITKTDGIDVTGEVQCDSLDVDGSADISSSLNVSGNATFHGNVDLHDNDLLRIGSSDDLQIYHDGSNSYIKDGGTGSLIVLSSQFAVKNVANTENMIVADQDGAVNVYHNGSGKLATKSDGIDVTGEVQCDSLDVDGAADFTGVITSSEEIRVDRSGATNLCFTAKQSGTTNASITAGGTGTFSSLDVNGAADIAGELTVNKLVVDDDGSGGPTVSIRTDDQNPWALQISNDTWSNGTNRGLLFFQANDGTFYQRLQGVSSTFEPYLIQQSNGSSTNTGIQLTESREVKLYYQNDNKLTTKSDGIDVIGEVQCDSLDVDGSGDFTGGVTFRGGASAVEIAASSDIRLISGNWTGEHAGKIQHHSNYLYFQGGNSGFIFRDSGGTDRAYLDDNGRLKLGTATEGHVDADNLTLRDGGHCGITIRSGTSNNANIFFSDATSGAAEYDGYIQYQQSNRALIFGTAQTERLTINTNGAWGIEGASNYGSSGQVLTSNGNDSPTWQTVSAGATNVNGLSDGVTNSSGVTIGLGTNALANDDGSGRENTALGYNALNATTSGSDNVAVGHDSLVSNTTGQRNVGVGWQALESCTTGERNTVIGASASSNLTTGSNNTTLGFNAGNTFTGNNNLCLGNSASPSSTSVSNEITLGDSSITKLRVPGLSFEVGSSYLNLAGELNLMGTEGAKYIDANVGASGTLNIRGTAGGDTAHSNLAQFTRNGSVSLFHNGSAKFATTSSGISVTGNVIATAQLQTGNTGSTEPGNGNTNIGFSARENGRFFASSGGSFSCINRNEGGGVLRFFLSGSHKGIIEVSSGGVSYSSNSDYRLKENVVTLDGAITRVKQLQPKRFNFIEDPGQTVDGFLAHEAQTVVPEAVTGTHNAVETWQADDELPEGVSVGDNKLDSEGNTIPDYQGIDQAKLVPLLTAALQEAIAKIETLETKVAALEAQ